VADEGGLEFRMLGPLQVIRSGQPVSLGGRQQRAVLAMLLVEADKVVSLERLVAALWGGQPPGGAVQTVQTYVFHLRRALEPQRARGVRSAVLVTADRGYLLEVDRSAVDAAVFETRLAGGRAALDAGRHAQATAGLSGALQLWRGEVLADVADYEFARIEAARLGELRLVALEARIDADLALGRHAMLTAELQRLVTDHPLRERLHSQLVLALYRCGRQSDALAAYQRVYQTLAHQLGVGPCEPLQRLQRAVLAQDAALDWHPPAAAIGTAPVPDRTPITDTAPPTSTAPVNGGARAEATDSAHPLARAKAVGPSVAPAAPRAGRVRTAMSELGARRLLATAVALVVLGGACIAVAAGLSGGRHGAFPANSVGLLGPDGLAGQAVQVGTSPDGLAYGAGALWAANTAGNSLSRIDPRTHTVVQTIGVGSAPDAVAVTGHDVWVANGGDGTVSRVSADSNTVVQQVKVGNEPAAIGSGPSGVWVANGGDGTVSRIDPATGKVTRQVPVGTGPDGLAVGAGAVWVANGRDGTVSRVDPATGTVSSPVFVGAGPEGVAVTDGAVWVTCALDLSVWRLDPATGQVVTVIRVGDGPRAVAAGPGGVWVSDEFDGTVTRIDPGSNRVVGRTSVGASPRGLAVAGSSVWVAAQGFAAGSHRGGTLTVASSKPAGTMSIDPAVAYDPETFHVLTMVYDGLVGLHRTDGAAGMTLVPDLATELPRPTDGGRTYTFTLRHGIRYSTGAVVRPGDIRRGIEREFTTGGGFPAYFAGIVGASACLPGPRPPARCDLSRGIVTDDTAYTVTIHLTAPDPDFLYKLTNLVKAAPPGASAADIGSAPLPATGPYMISRYHKGKLLTLVRNPYFRQWSFAAQPAGYPDNIRFEQVAGSQAQVNAVTTGRADLVDFAWPWDSPPPGLLAGLGVRYPARLHSDFMAVTEYEALNTRIPPFSDARVRQALSYAVDRSKLLEFGGGPARAAATCQILPPDFPGWQPYCPYTLNPGPDGTWHGPDLATARRLIAASHTAGSSIRLWNLNLPVTRHIGGYLVGLLRQLGYRVTVHELSEPQYFSQVSNSRQQVQIGYLLLGADYPAAANFFTDWLTCASFTPDSNGNTNLAEYCNPAADSLINHAQAAQATDPGAAGRLWAEADRTITNDAPWIPLGNDKEAALTSARVGNYQDNPILGPLLDQMWTR
jgi:YVTN family beta-propeller protein